MHLPTLLAIGASLCAATPVTTTAFLAKFDNIVGSGLTPELDPVPTPYYNLGWPGFNVYNATQGVSLLKAPSPPNFAASVTLLQALQGKPAMITTAGTNAKSFTLTSLANACVVASQTGVLAESCTIQYNGTKAVGAATVSALCTFTADLLKPKAALCTLPGSFSGLKSVSIVPVTATLPPATTVLLIDNVGGSVSV